MPTDRLSATFQALADPTRRAILARLALGETSVSELAEPFDISARRLQASEGAGARRPDRARARGAVAALPDRTDALKGVDDWLEEYRRLWEQRLDRLEDYLRTLQAERGRTKAPAKKPEKKRGRKK